VTEHRASLGSKAITANTLLNNEHDGMNRAPFPLTLTLSPGERGQPRPRLGLPSVCVLSQRVVSAERGVRSSLPMNLCVRPASAVSVPELAPQSRESRRGRGSRAEIAGLGSWLLSRWAREERRPLRTGRDAQALRARADLPPLPAGEGRGEGERVPRAAKCRLSLAISMRSRNPCGQTQALPFSSRAPPEK
jgi:hypothetical protein